jgi:hypothetical protein
MKKLLAVLVFLLTAGLLIMSCHKHRDLPEPEPDFTLEQDYISMLNDLNTAQASVDSAYLNNNAGSCASYNFDYDTTGGVYGKFTLSFPGAACADTIIRSGQIEVHHRGGYKEGTLKDTIVFVGFTIGGRSITGYRFRQSLSSTTFTIIDNVVISFPSGKAYSLLSNTNRTNDTVAKTTMIKGNSTGSLSNGNRFSVVINGSTTGPVTHLTSFPLKYDWICPMPFRDPVSGAFTFTNITANIIRTINFEKRISKDFWESSCSYDTATFVSPEGNLYYIPVK